MGLVAFVGISWDDILWSIERTRWWWGDKSAGDVE